MSPDSQENDNNQKNPSSGAPRKPFNLSKADPETSVSDSQSQETRGTSKLSPTRKTKRALLVVIILACLGVYFLFTQQAPRVAGPSEGPAPNAPESTNARATPQQQGAQHSPAGEQPTIEPQPDQSPIQVANGTVPASAPISNIASKDSQPPTIDSQSLDDKALAVIRGRYGNGLERRERLGDEYVVIQTRVNEILRSQA